jgi:hypothetical protein
LICFITTPGHSRTVNGLRHWPFEGAHLPRVGTLDYVTLLRTDRLPYATYVFADIERLYPWERRAVAERFAGMRAAGLRCLNDPARVLTRYPLLRALARAGINPFDVYLAEDAPQPRRFPVFVRSESGHGGATSALLHSQEALDSLLRERMAAGEPLSDCLVVEFAQTRRPDGLWSKSGSFRVGDALHYDQTDLWDGWIVKEYDGSRHLWSAARIEEDRRAVLANEPPDAVRRAFEIAGIEWGRADHAAAEGGHAVFEINTNPYLNRHVPPPQSAYAETRLLARRRLAELLGGIDSGAGDPVALQSGPVVAMLRRRGQLAEAEPLRP